MRESVLISHGMERAESKPARFALSRLALTDFRCYAGLRLETDARPVVLFGPNGAGKTNVLEAISLLSPGRGLRRAPFAEVERRDAAPESGWAVAAALTTPQGDISVGTGRDPKTPRAESRDDGSPSSGSPSIGAGAEGSDGERPSGRRTVRIDGRAAKGPAALAEVLPVVWITPEMDRLFLDGSSGRRRFLDRAVYGFDAGHAARLSSYERAMRQRSRLLRSGILDRGWLATLEGQMAADGVAIAAARIDIGSRIAERCAPGFGPFPGAGLEIAGAPEDWLGTVPALEAEERLREALAASREADARTGGAAVGPHRSDMLVRHRAKDMPAHQCSTGEQKALLIGLVLAVAAMQAEARRAAPVMLLDEVAAHLDEDRRAALFARILDLGAQAWFTGTERAPFGSLDGTAQFFRICDAAAAAV